LGDNRERKWRIKIKIRGASSKAKRTDRGGAKNSNGGWVGNVEKTRILKKEEKVLRRRTKTVTWGEGKASCLSSLWGRTVEGVVFERIIKTTARIGCYDEWTV
jgi:hypothetical protein